MKMLFICISVSTEKISQYHFKPISEQPVQVYRPEPGYMRPLTSKVTSHGTIPCSLMQGSPSVGHDTSIGFQLEIRDNLILYGCQNKNNITYEQMKDDITYTNKYKNKHKILHEKIDKA